MKLEQKIIDAIGTSHQCDAHHHAGNATIDVAEGTDAEIIAHLINEPSDKQPPAGRTRHQASKPNDVEPPMLGIGRKKKVGAGKQGNIEKDD